MLSLMWSLRSYRFLVTEARTSRSKSCIIQGLSWHELGTWLKVFENPCSSSSPCHATTEREGTPSFNLDFAGSLSSSRLKLTCLPWWGTTCVTISFNSGWQASIPTSRTGQESYYKCYTGLGLFSYHVSSSNQDTPPRELSTCIYSPLRAGELFLLS